ncbi:FAD-dependent oxidoreductase [Candidatus Contubernalis alkaliaceticus]|uniref:FAD-dependent oxidoreductase n=1 Tax=Candidatus Contubernalis alkaliaceticus TaxID=338645 RepID=UPI001F4C4336|nr:NAD(P)/FAD-dependent oxidoreductase [Candidatus Contubernalis alkalaceticus]UNC90725.1 NAD(P)/FAD-dependent oxidoreductase [Candidatus Contubernalis alkalaceticus]
MGRIAVIGGGPAGLFAALEAAERGYQVSLYEKNRIGENINCAEGYFDTLKLLGKPESGILFKVKKIFLEMKKHYKIDCGNFNLWMIDRAKWQKDLGEKAKEQGVCIREGIKVEEKDLKDLQKQNQWVIDASGTGSVTSKLYNFKAVYKESSARVVQYVMEGDFSHLGENIKVGIEPHYTGYYWIFPKGNIKDGFNKANVGIGFLKKPEGLSIRWELERVLKKEGLENYQIVKKSGGCISVKALDSLVYDNVLLAGDAAGLVSPLHAGGIDLACISGKVAVQEAEKGAHNYQKRLFEIVGLKLKMEQDLLTFWEKLDYDAFEEIFGAAVVGEGKLTPAMLWKYRSFLKAELNIMKSLLAGVVKMDWQGSCRDGNLPSSGLDC